jgi:hypothetical protein
MDEISEYQALRATIRERGTLRVCAILAGVVAWGALAVAVSLWNLRAGAFLIPLVVLAASYEVNFFLHTGVERIGRYVQVFHEEASHAIGWETTAMNYGTKFAGGPDPLFTTLFQIANALNFMSSLHTVDRSSAWTMAAVLAHATLAYRIVSTKRAAGAQRANDLERYRNLAQR